MESLYEQWCKRDPEWEERYLDSVIKVYSDYGKGSNQYLEMRGKIFGAGFEVFILAFFIGLYSNQTKPLVDDKAKRKKFGWAIVKWGTQEAPRIGRKQYPMLRQYMFAALIARTDIDFIALDKGELPTRKAVDTLLKKMEEYANFGFDYIHEKMEDNPNCFFNEMAYLNLFSSFIASGKEEDVYVEEEPDSLDLE